MKKRSLLVATAMLLVAILAATGATYAWFNGNTAAKSTIDMGVANASSLEISSGSSGWKSVLSNTDLGIDGTKSWSDFSTTDLTTFYSDVYSGDENTIPSGYKVDNGVISVDINFRSTEEGDVKIAATSSLTAKDGTTANTKVAPALRVGLNGGNGAKIFATAAGSYDNAVDSTTTNTGTQTWSAINNSETIAAVKMTQNSETGYYEGTATFYFWVEGPLCNNSMTTASTTANASLVFEQ